MRHDRVVMVGDGINDLGAFTKADTAILTVQQSGNRPEELFRAADYVITHVREILPIIGTLLRHPTLPDRDDSVHHIKGNMTPVPH